MTMAATNGSRMSLSSAMASTRTMSAATQNNSCRSTRISLLPSLGDAAAQPFGPSLPASLPPSLTEES